MSTQVQFRRGSTAEHSSFTGAAGEITVDTTLFTAVVHDGSTAGGYPLVNYAANGAVIVTDEFRAKSYNETSVTASSVAGVATLNCETGNFFDITLDENTTFVFSNPPQAGEAFGFVLKLTQDGTARTITWPTSVNWSDGTAPDAPASGETNVYSFVTNDGGDDWYGFLGSAAMS